MYPPPLLPAAAHCLAPRVPADTAVAAARTARQRPYGWAAWAWLPLVLVAWAPAPGYGQATPQAPVSRNAGASASAAAPGTTANARSGTAAPGLRVENAEDKAELAARISEAIQRAKDKHSPDTRATATPTRPRPGDAGATAARSRPSGPEAVPTITVRIGKPAPPKPVAQAAPVQPKPPAVQDPGASRRYIAQRAAEIVASLPPPPEPEASTIAWTYAGPNGPAAWAGLHSSFATCGKGLQQSPVQITPEALVAGPSQPLQTTLQAFGGTLVHTGHGIELEVTGGANLLHLAGQPWRLVRVQFRHPAEERVHHHDYPMATDLVYRAQDGRLAVVSVPMRSGFDNRFLAKAWPHLPLAPQERVALPAGALSLQDLLPPDLRYFQYMGSISTPPCTEGVMRLVLKTPVSVGLEQYRQLTRVAPANARPVQPLHGRLVREAL